MEQVKVDKAGSKVYGCLHRESQEFVLMHSSEHVGERRECSPSRVGSSDADAAVSKASPAF